MSKQKGAALIVVLSLLTVSLMVGLSSMQSSQLDERLAGNYKAKSQVQMAAEESASYAFDLLGTLSGGVFVDVCPDKVNDCRSDIASWSSFSGSGSIGFSSSVPEEKRSPACPGDAKCEFRYISINSDINHYGVGSGYYILSKAVIEVGGEVVSESEPVFVNLRLSGFNWLAPFMAAGELDSFSAPSSNAGFYGIPGLVPAFSLSTEADKDVIEESGAKNIVGEVRAGFPIDTMFASPQDADSFVEFIDDLKGSATIMGPVTDNNVSVGSVGDEEITYVNGDVSGNGFSGAGIVIIDGDYRSNGNPSFQGLFIVLGDYIPGSGGGGDDLEGAVLVAPYESNSSSDDIDYKFKKSNIVFGGGGSNDFRYSQTYLDKAYGIMPDSAKKKWGPGDGGSGSGSSAEWVVMSWK